MRNTWLLILVTSLLVTGCASGPTSAAAGAGGATSAPGECAIVGTWRGPVPAGMLAGSPLSMVFAEDGTAQGVCGRITLNSTWQRSGNLVQVIDVSARPAFAQCDPSLVGRYTLEFAADCQSVVAINGEDPCDHRRQALLGFRASRQ